MSTYTYKTILKQAQTCHKNVSKNHKTGMWSWWGYYFAKALLNPKKDVTVIKIDNTDSKGDYFSQLIGQGKYLSCAKYLTEYCEKHHKMPKNIPYNGKHINNRLFTYLMAKGLIAYNELGKYKTSLNLNSKVFTAPTETGNAVYDYFVKKTGKKPKTLDDILEYVCNYFHYQGYYDDQKSNKQVMDTKAGNCVDLLQWLMNMTEPLGYDSKCIHVQCRTSGTGHVFDKFRHKKNTDGKWVTRDPAAVCQNSIHNVWCENGYLLAENPDWFLSNKNR
jgi:hypothetical protein